MAKPKKKPTSRQRTYGPDVPPKKQRVHGPDAPPPRQRTYGPDPVTKPHKTYGPDVAWPKSAPDPPARPRSRAYEMDIPRQGKEIIRRPVTTLAEINKEKRRQARRPGFTAVQQAVKPRGPLKGVVSGVAKKAAQLAKRFGQTYK